MPEMDIRSALLYVSPHVSCRKEGVLILHLRRECLVDYLSNHTGSSESHSLRHSDGKLEHSRGWHPEQTPINDLLICLLPRLASTVS